MSHSTAVRLLKNELSADCNIGDVNGISGMKRAKDPSKSTTVQSDVKCSKYVISYGDNMAASPQQDVEEPKQITTFSLGRLDSDEESNLIDENTRGKQTSSKCQPPVITLKLETISVGKVAEETEIIDEYGDNFSLNPDPMCKSVNTFEYSPELIKTFFNTESIRTEYAITEALHSRTVNNIYDGTQARSNGSTTTNIGGLQTQPTTSKRVHWITESPATHTNHDGNMIYKELETDGEVKAACIINIHEHPDQQTIGLASEELKVDVNEHSLNPNSVVIYNVCHRK
jgi:hypothetical protein